MFCSIGWCAIQLCILYCNVSFTWSSILNILFFPFCFWVFGRLLEENDTEIQMRVLDCLLIWKDDYILPYVEHLRNLISSKNLREELTTWSLSRESEIIEECHRAYLVPLVIRLLMPRVRKLKGLASRKVYSIWVSWGCFIFLSSYFFFVTHAFHLPLTL